MGVRGVSGNDLRALAASLSPRRPPEPVQTNEDLTEGFPDVARASPAAQTVKKEDEKSVPNKPKEEPVTADKAGTRLRVDGATDRIVAQILDRKGEVINQIPPEELLKILARTREVYRKLFDQLA